MYPLCWANRQEWYYPFYYTLLVPFFTVAWFLNCGVALCAAGRVALQCTIWYIHTFWDKISNLVMISCYMWYYSVIIYKNKYTKRCAKSNILQYKACQIDTKFPKNHKKVWNGEFQIRNSINQDSKKPQVRHTETKTIKYDINALEPCIKGAKPARFRVRCISLSAVAD